MGLLKKMVSYAFACMVYAGMASAEVSSAQEAWRALGMLHVDGKPYCHATLVDADLVITAAHCVVSSEGESRLERMTMVLPGNAPIPLVGVAYIPGFVYQSGNRAGVRALEQDIAVVQLREKIDVMPINIMSFAGENAVWVPSETTLEECPSRSLPILTLFHVACAREQGFSGAPVFRIEEDVIHIVGIVTARDPFENGIVAHSIEAALGKMEWMSVEEMQ